MIPGYTSRTQYTVYFAQALDKVKIGCSRRPRERILTVSEWIPFPVKLLATMPGTYALEAALHRMFAEEWSHGEWFNLSPRLFDFIDRVARGLPVEIVDRSLSLEANARRKAIADKKRISRRLHEIPQCLQDEVRMVPKGVAVPAPLLAKVRAEIAKLPRLEPKRRIRRRAA